MQLTRYPNGPLTGHQCPQQPYALPLILALALAAAAWPAGAQENNRSQTIYRCERPGQSPLFAYAPCGKDSGSGEQLGRAVLAAPPPMPLQLPASTRATTADTRIAEPAANRAGRAQATD